MVTWLMSVVVLIAAYCIGSFPTGYVIASLSGINDIRSHGSGNIGATNVARVLGAHYFIPVFVIDAAKAAVYLMVLKSYGWDETFVLAAALLLLFGNGCSLFLNFTGGKGFATTVGILWVMQPLLLYSLVPVWFVVVFITRTIGMASAATCACLALGAWFVSPYYSESLVYMLMGLWGLWRHRDNLKRYADSKGWLH